MQEDKEAANVQFIKKIFPPEVVVIWELRELIAFSLDTLREVKLGDAGVLVTSCPSSHPGRSN